MKKYFNYYYLIVAYFITSITLFSFISHLKIAHKLSDVKNRHQKIVLYKNLKKARKNKLPPNLTNLNNRSMPIKGTIAYNKIINNIVKNAKKYLGTPYRYGGNSIKGIDCSALVKQAFEPYKTLPRISNMQAKAGKNVSKDNLMKCDLLFFSMDRGRCKKRKITHVGMVLEKNKHGVSFIHASQSHGVMISNLDKSFWKKTFVMARRIIT